MFKNSTSGRWALWLVAPILALCSGYVHSSDLLNPEESPAGFRGTVSVVWGDPAPGDLRRDVTRFFLVDENQRSVEVVLSEDMIRTAGGASNLDGRRVEVDIEPNPWVFDLHSRNVGAVVRSLKILSNRTPSKALKAVSGSQPWVSILCKFSDVSAEPESLSYFQNMYSSTYPGLDHYWRELSYGIANVSGSTAVEWVNLPHPVSYYQTPDGGDLDAMVADCTAAADPYVYFPGFVGINMMFNSAFGPYAWGGSRYLTLDGVSRLYRVTWEPPWGYEDICVIAHEMGHGFGLPHSNNAEGGYPYDNPWDVMSDSWNWAVSDSTYGTLGKHTIAYHKDSLGWIGAAEKLEVNADGVYRPTVDHLALQSTSNFRLVTVQIPGSSNFYTVEVRDFEGYDGNLPGFATIIHEVDASRQEDAWLVDPLLPANGADEGAMWRVGECFDDDANEIEICVEAITSGGFDLRISYGDAGIIFDDGFESGNTTAWSAAVP